MSDRVRQPALAAAFLVLLLGPGPGGTGPAPLPDSVAPCVPCHDRGENDQVAEWLASPYSERQGGRGCTECHVRLCSGAEAPGARPDNLDAELPPGPTKAARLTVTATCTGEEVTAEVAISNVGVGHLLPTGPSERALVLEVIARDRNEVSLPFMSGPKLPEANRASVVLSGGGLAGAGANDAAVIVRPRLRPFATDVSRYRFEAPESGPVRISARLVLVPGFGAPSEIAESSSVCRSPGDEP